MYEYSTEVSIYIIGKSALVFGVWGVVWDGYYRRHGTGETRNSSNQ